MEITILFNGQTSRSDLTIGWGLAFFVGGQLLFDTGENGEWLLANMKTIRVSPECLTSTVISHDHWDHSGGLPEILQAKKGLKVYGCENFSADLKKKITNGNGVFVALDGVSEILPGIYSTGAITGIYAERRITEQALVIKTNKGISVLTGCAHPGIMKMLRVVRRIFPTGKPGHNFYLVAGGFHLMEESPLFIKEVAINFKGLGIKKVAPMHCCGVKAEEVFHEIYRQNFLTLKAGDSFQV